MKKKLLLEFVHNGNVSIFKLLSLSKKIKNIHSLQESTFSKEQISKCHSQKETFINNKLYYVPIKLIGTEDNIGWVCMTKLKQEVVDYIRIILSIQFLQKIKHDYNNILNFCKNVEFIDEKTLKINLLEFYKNSI